MFCFKCGKDHQSPVGKNCPGPIVGSLDERTSRSGHIAKAIVTTTSTTHTPVGGPPTPGVLPVSNILMTANMSGGEDIPVVKDSEEEELIQQLQQLACEERKAGLKEKLRAMQERVKNPLQNPTGGGAAPGLLGPGGAPRTSLTQEDLERERSKWSYQDFFEPKVKKEPTYQEFMAATLEF